MPVAAMVVVCLISTMVKPVGAVEDLVLKANGPNFSFLVLGDWGMGTKQQLNVAEAMNKEAGTMPDSLFVLNVGDNFYHDGRDSEGHKMGGVSDVNDPLWKEYFEDVYNGDHLRKLPFISILGNHDYMGNLSAQMHGLRNPRFVIPDRNYVTRVVDEKTGEKLATFVHIDTTPVAGIYRDKPENPTMGVNLDNLDDGDTFGWLNRTLARVADNKGYKFVVGHHQVVSMYGSETSHKQAHLHESMDNVRKILEHHRVDAYFNGHLHALEHRTLNDVSYIVSGGGGKNKDYPVQQLDEVIAGWAAGADGVKGGFATVSVDLAKGEANIRYLDSHGKELFRPKLYAPRSTLSPLQLNQQPKQLPRSLRIGVA